MQVFTISVANAFTFENGANQVECQMSYFAKKLVAQVMHEMSPQDMQWRRKVWSKLMEAPKIQALMPDKLACLMQAIKGTHIIENLSNSLNHKVGALKRDGVRAR